MQVGTSDFGGDSSVVSRLDALTGELEWSRKISGVTVSCMGLWNNLLVIPTFSNISDYPAFTALDIETSDVVWQNHDSFGGYWDSSPVIVDDVIYITGFDCTPRAFDASTGTLIWEAVSVIDDCPTLSYYNELLYHPQACLNAATGTVIWERSAFPHGSSGIADNCLFYGKSYPFEGSVFAVDCSDGSEIWSYEIAGGPYGIVSSPSIVDGVMYIAGTDWNLYAFGTGLKYTYHSESLNSQVGWNELIATSYDNGVAVASDTVNFYINPAGIEFEPSRKLLLTGSQNPFSSSTELSFSLSASGFTSVEIYDLTGRCISNLADNDLSQGDHTVNWGGTDQNGNGVPPGLYICRIQSGGVIETTGLCLLR